MFENPRTGRQARNFRTNVPKILDLKSSSEQIFSQKLPLGAPAEPEVEPSITQTKAALVAVLQELLENNLNLHLRV